MTTSRRPRSWSGLALWILAAVMFLGVRPVWAKSAATAAPEDLLRSVVARITVRTTTGSDLCHGFMAIVGNGIAYIVTAKHCIEGPSPTTIQRHEMASDLTITVAYANGETGSSDHIFWHPDRDDLVIAASIPADQPPRSLTTCCARPVSATGSVSRPPSPSP